MSCVVVVFCLVLLLLLLSSVHVLLLLLLVAAVAVAARGSCVFLSGCFSGRVFSHHFCLFSVIQALAESLLGALCAARRVHVSWSSR